MPSNDAIDLATTEQRGLIALTRVLTTDAFWAPAEETDMAELTASQQLIVEELHRLAGLHDGHRAAAIAIDLLRHDGHAAAVDAFLANDHADALAEDETRSDEAWGLFWTGFDLPLVEVTFEVDQHDWWTNPSAHVDTEEN